MDTISIIDCDTIDKLSDQDKQFIDEIGIKSAKAQNLLIPLTTVEKIAKSDQKLLLYYSSTEKSRNPLGLLKYGYKKLYFYNDDGNIKATNCYCILDFYVLEKYQRQGIGILLFQTLLEILDIDPGTLAYDRPSSKLLSFLKKHFNLMKPNFQPNNYVIFQNMLVTTNK